MTTTGDTDATGTDEADDLPATMAVAVYRGRGEIVVERRPVPRPGSGEVLVEVAHCGICGSDIHTMLEGWGKPGVVEGHEWTGNVAAVGRDAGPWAVGDAVVGGPSPRCGRCRPCREGRPSQCENRQRSMTDELARDGAFADFVLVDARSLLALPDGLSSRAAALAEPLAVALHGISRAGIAEGDSVMVFGAGPIGALSVAAMVARGLGPVTVVEPAETRRDLALALGAQRGAGAVGPGDLPPVGARSHRHPGRARGARVLGPEVGHGGRLLPAAPGRTHGHGGRRHRAPDLRSQPHAAQRADRLRLVRLRRRRLRPRPWSCSARTASPSTPSSTPTTSASTGCWAPCTTWPTGASRPRPWWCHPAARRRPR